MTNVGDIASEFTGHIVVDRSSVFGLGPPPEITHFGGTEPTENATNGAWVELDEGLTEATKSAEVLAAVAALNSAVVRTTEENRNPTDLTIAREAFKLVVSKGHLSWSSKSTLRVERCGMLAVVVKEGGWKLTEEAEAHYPEADVYLKEMDPLISIPVEGVDADVVLNMKERLVLTDQEVIDSGAQKRVVPTSGVMYMDDQICLAIMYLAIHPSVRSHASEGIVTRLGKCGLSMKAVHQEMVFRVVQNVTGQLCDCIQGEWRPTPASVGKLDRYLKEYLVKVQARNIPIQFRPLGRDRSVVAEGIHTRLKCPFKWI